MLRFRAILTLLILSLLAGTSLLFASPPQRVSDSNGIDEAPLPSDPTAKASREAKNRRYNHGGRDLLALPTDTSISLIGCGEALPLLPTGSTPLILIGTVVSSQPYLSEDHSYVYTEYSVEIEKWLKKPAGTLPTIGNKLVVDRSGGALRQQSGYVIRYSVQGTGMASPLHVNQSYVLFLNLIHDRADVMLGPAFRFSEGWVYQLGESEGRDMLIRPAYAPDELSHEEGFMNALRLAIANPPSPRFHSAIDIPAKKN